MASAGRKPTVKADITLDSTKFRRELLKSIDEVKDFARKAQQNMDGAAGGADKTGTAMDKLGKAATFAAGAWAAVQGASAALDWAKEADKLRGLEDAFQGFARAAGIDARDALKTLQDESRGQINRLDLLEGANNALALGAAKTRGQLGELVSGSQALARAFGLDAKKAFEDLVTGFSRGSNQILDNIGIQVEGAFTLEKGYDALRAKLSALPAPVEDFTAASNRAATAWTDLKLEAGKLIGDVLTGIAGSVIPVLQNATRGIARFSAGFMEAAEALGLTTAKGDLLGDTLGNIVAIVGGLVGSFINGVIVIAGGVEHAINGISFVFEWLGLKAAKAALYVEDFLSVFGLTEPVADAAFQHIDAQVAALEENTAKKSAQISSKYGRAIQAMSEATLGFVLEASPQFAELAQSFGVNIDELKSRTDRATQSNAAAATAAQRTGAATADAARSAAANADDLDTMARSLGFARVETDKATGATIALTQGELDTIAAHEDNIRSLEAMRTAYQGDAEMVAIYDALLEDARDVLARFTAGTRESIDIRELHRRRLADEAITVAAVADSYRDATVAAVAFAQVTGGGGAGGGAGVGAGSALLGAGVGAFTAPSRATFDPSAFGAFLDPIAASPSASIAPVSGRTVIQQNLTINAAEDPMETLAVVSAGLAAGAQLRGSSPSPLNSVSPGSLGSIRE